jgi:hypothetical protein
MVLGAFRGTLPVYPWDHWFKRRRFNLVRGNHYNCQPHSMAVLVRINAARRGIKVSVKISEGVLTVTKK